MKIYEEEHALKAYNMKGESHDDMYIGDIHIYTWEM
jgi:hypothetical protein